MAILTLTLALGDIVHAGDHVITLEHVSGEGFAVVRVGEQVKALEHGGEWLDLGAGVALALSQRAKIKKSRARVSFKAAKEIAIYRKPVES